MGDTSVYLYADKLIPAYVIEIYEDGKKIKSTRHENDGSVVRFLFQYHPPNLIADKLPPGVPSVGMDENREVISHNEVIDAGTLDDIIKQVRFMGDNQPGNKPIDARLSPEQP